MGKIIVICGKPETGKTNIAKQITKGKKAVWVPYFEIKSPFAFSSVSTETEVIVFDGLTDKNREQVRNIISSEKISIQKKGVKEKEVIAPDMIFIFDSLKGVFIY